MKKNAQNLKKLKLAVETIRSSPLLTVDDLRDVRGAAKPERTNAVNCT